MTVPTARWTRSYRVIEGLERHAFGEARFQALQPLADRFHDRVRIGAAQRQNEALYGLATTVLGHGAVACEVAYTDESHVADAQDLATLRAEHDLLQVAGSADGAFGAHDECFLAVGQPAGAVITIGGCDRVFDIGDAQARRRECSAVGDDLERAHETPQGINVGNPGYRSEDGTDGPIEEAPALLEGQIAALDGEHENVGERRGDRRQPAGDVRR